MWSYRRIIELIDCPVPDVREVREFVRQLPFTPSVVLPPGIASSLADRADVGAQVEPDPTVIHS
jgi:hypothetical protein